MYAALQNITPESQYAQAKIAADAATTIFMLILVVQSSSDGGPKAAHSLQETEELSIMKHDAKAPAARLQFCVTLARLMTYWRRREFIGLRMIDRFNHKLLLFILSTAFATTVSLFWPATPAKSGQLPAILVSAANEIPACVTPGRLMMFVNNRNRRLDPPAGIEPRFSDISLVYKAAGECVEIVNDKCVGIRWDYAFFQMLIETNFLLFTGSVKGEDNNFAGIGANISGKPGVRFASLREGVLAHLQHVSMYAGVSIRHPAYHRTKLVEQDIREAIGDLGRPVTFSDLAKLWTGTDPIAYASSIELAATRFDSEFCPR